MNQHFAAVVSFSNQQWAIMFIIISSPQLSCFPHVRPVQRDRCLSGPHTCSLDPISCLVRLFLFLFIYKFILKRQQKVQHTYIKNNNKKVKGSFPVIGEYILKKHNIKLNKEQGN